MKKINEAYATPDEIATHMSSLNTGTDDKLRRIKAIKPIVEEEHHELLKHAPKFNYAEDQEARTRHYALKDYSDSSEGLNMKLIYGSKLDEQDSDYISAFHHTKFALPHDLHVYSGLKFYNPEPHFTNGNGVINLPAYTSASLHPENAALFTAHNADAPSYENESHIIHFHLPKGFRNGTYMAAYGNAPSEREYTLHPGKFRLVGKETREFKTSRSYSKKLHIWSVVPHSSLNEAYTHDAERIEKLWHQNDYEFGDNPTRGEWHDTYIKSVPLLHAAEYDTQHTELDNQQDPHRVPKDFKAIAHYTNGNARAMNIGLITKHKLYVKKPEGEEAQWVGHDIEAHHQLMEAYERMPPLEREAHVYSGMGINPGRLTRGGIFKTAAHTSTSLNPAIAMDMGYSPYPISRGGVNYRSDRHLLHFHLPVGFKGGIYVGKAGSQIWSHQHEMILKPGLKWKITGKERVKSHLGGLTIWHATPHEDSLKEAVLSAHVDDHESTALDDILKGEESSREHAELRAHFKRPDDHTANGIRMFTVDASALHSHYLKGVPAAPLTQMSKSAMEKYHNESPPLKKSYDVYSGLGVYDPSDEMQKGIFTNKTWISASLEPHVAAVRNNFKYKITSNADDDVLPNHIIAFHLPEGSQHGFYAGHLSKFPSEREFIIAPHQLWKIHSKEVTTKGRTIWHVRPHTLTEATHHDLENFKGTVFSSLDRRNALKEDAYRQHQLLATDDKNGYRTNVSYRSVVAGYKGHSGDINHTLIDAHRLGKTIEQWADNGMSHAYQALVLKNAIRDHGVELPEDMHVYSGTRIWQAAQAMKGGLLHTAAFTSTSLNPLTARAFIHHGYEQPDVLHFHLPKGFKRGLYLEHKDKELHHSSEFEYLLDAGQTWRHVKTETAESDYTTANYARVTYQIHTLVPHEEPLKEASFHDHDAFQEHRSSLYGRDIEAQHSLLNIAFGRVPNADEKAAIKAYKSDSAPMNYSLIGVYDAHDWRKMFALTSDHHRTQADELSRHLRNHAFPLPHETHVYSGVGGFDIDGLISKGRGIFHTPAFTSTTLDPMKSKWFADKAGEGIKSPLKILHFKLPAGYNRGVYIDSDAIRSWSHSEKEYLIDRGQHWKFEKKAVFNDQVRKRPLHVYSFTPHEIKPKLTEAYNPLSAEDIEKHFTLDRAQKIEKPERTGYVTRYGWESLADTHPHEEFESPEVYAQHEHLMNLHEDHLTDDQKHTIYCYTAGRASEINYDLIAHRNEDGKYDVPKQFEHPTGRSQHYVGQLDRAIKNAPALDHEVHAYSALGFNPKPLVNSKSRLFRMPAYTSTSINPHIAFGILGSKRDLERYKNGLHLMHFKLPAGYDRALYLAGNAHRLYSHQRELLLRRNSLFKMTGHRVHLTEGMPPIHIWTAEPHMKPLAEAIEPFSPEAMKQQWTATRRNVTPAYAVNKYWNIHSGMHPEYEWEHPSVATQHEHLTQLHAVHNFTEDEKNTVFDYTEGHSGSINDPLIHSRDENGFDWRTKHLDSAMEKAAALDHEVHAYSATSFNPALKSRQRIFKSPAFISASINPHVAFGISKLHRVKKSNSSTREHHIIHFILPKGSKLGVYTGDLGSDEFTSQREFIIKRNTKWQLVGHHLHDVTDPHGDYSWGSASRLHIWSVKPHEDELKETTFHTRHFFGHHEFTDYEKQTKKSPSAAAQKYADMKLSIFKKALTDAGDQHYRMPATPNLTMEEKIALNNYTSETLDASYLVNYPLLGHDVTGTPHHESRKHIVDHINKHLPSAMAKAAPLTEEVHAYSGLKRFNPSKHFDAAGGIVHTPSYTSTTIRPDIVNSFAGVHPNNEKHILHFKLPIGYKRGLYITDHSDVPAEHEYLLDKGQKWRLVGKQTVNETAKWRDYGASGGSHVKVHIWSLEPHDEPLKEMAYHHDDMYDYGTDKSFTGLDALQGKSEAVSSYLKGYEAEHEQLKNHHSPGSDGISTHHLNAVLNYTENSYDLNNHLIHGSPVAYKVHKMHKLLQEFLDTTKPLDKDIHVYSGLGSDKVPFRKGRYFISPGYVSASISPEIAAMHNNTKAYNKHTHILHIHLPKGSTHGRYIAQFSNYEHEGEFLLKSGLKYKVLGKTIHEDPEGSGSKIHVWHATPHDESLKEMAYAHDPHYEYSSDKSFMGLDMAAGQPNAVKEYLPKNIDEHEHLKKLHCGNVSIDQEFAIRDYSQDSSYYNNSLHKIGAVPSSKAENHKHLMSYLNAAPPLDRDIHVYSGFGDYNPEQHIDINGHMHSKIYLSTSISPEIAVIHNEEKGFSGAETHILHVHLPKGYTGGRYIARHSNYEHEGEFLLRPNQSFKVTGHEVDIDDDGAPLHVWHVKPFG